MRYLTSFLALMLFAVSLQAAEDYYVWVDENGVTNYAERDPKGIQAQHVTKDRRFGERYDEPDQRGSRPGAVSPEPGGSRPGATEPESPSTTQPAAQTSGDVDPDALIAEESAKIAEQIAKVKGENCDIGKRNLAQLQAFSRIRVTGDDGQERVLTDAERQAQIDEARQIIRDNCSG
jgi:hypothetical protein